MRIEIERKFMVTGQEWRAVASPGRLLRQGYFVPAGRAATIRVRCSADGAWLAIKGPREGPVRPEFEYEVPLADAEEMLRTLCVDRTIEKLRYSIEADGLVWNVDEFRGANSGLVFTEVELESSDQPVKLPSWVGEEITGREEYRNAVLAERRFRDSPALP
ncbi:CYTH domain-containing protein [Bosea sp. CRIB-10]|uniref:CYTH domain-containing protein n=1 Tax=Bosea sp. CRIB-10 TaxID=378404 RepID=UPI000B804FA5|nr:CYTH domain-containing protein [Bosea sp. CRIB-10]